MNAYDAQYEPRYFGQEIEPLQVADMTDSGVVIVCPEPDAAEWIFDYLIEIKTNTRRPFGTIGMNPRQPDAVRWTRAPRRSRFFREYRWSTEEIVSLVAEVWEEVGRYWLPMPAVALPPSPEPEPEPEEEEPLIPWSLEWMADAMEMSVNLLYRRLERGSHGYRYASRETHFDAYFRRRNWRRNAGWGEATGTLTPIQPRFITTYQFDQASALVNLNLIREERIRRREERAKERAERARRERDTR